ncbi:MAG TPA: non-ribosomal peptide synthetase [Actinocrinis sp.]|nr:non-ribosomal peptide synthetase [Actinocrinis sp.]
MRGNPTALLDLLAERAAAAPDAVAMIDAGGATATYAQLDARVRAAVARLRALGVRRQDRLVVSAAGDLGGAVLLLAAISAAVCCPINTLLAQDEFEATFDVLEPSAVVLFESGGMKLARAAEARQLTAITVSADPAETGYLRIDGPALESGRVLPEPSAGESLLLRTSGTTSVGKIVPLTAEHILAGANASVNAYNLTAADRCLNFMPLFHIQGLVGSIVASLVSGGSVVTLPAVEPKQALRSLEEHRATWFSASPTIHRLLVDQLKEEPVDCSSLRFSRSGAAALPAALRQELEAAYGVPILETYGMSEAHQIASTVMADHPSVAATGPAPAGMTPTGSRVAVLDNHGRVRTEPGSRGELVVSGDNVIERYFWPQDASAAFVDGWLRTGDLGTLAADGTVVITGRIKEMINRGGEKVSPYEVEDVLLRHPAVREAVAFGVADDVLTERLAAAVVLHPGAAAGEEELRRHAAARLAPFKVPGRILIQDELPTNAVGKLVRAQFGRLFAARFGPQEADAAGRDGHGGGDDTGGTGAGLPRTAMQAALVGLWAFALGRSSMGIDEDFFTLGGESLSAMALLRGVRDTFGVDISPVDLFDDLNTVERMAEAIRYSVGVTA